MKMKRSSFGFSKKHVVFFSAFLSLLVVILAWAYFEKEKKKLYNIKQNELGSVMQMMTRELSDWYVDEKHDAGVIAQNTFFTGQINRMLDSGSASERMFIKNYFLALKDEHDYADISLVSAQGRILAATRDPLRLDTLVLRCVRQAIKSRSVLCTDLYRQPEDGQISIDFIAPVFAPDGSSVSAIVFQMDPHSFLYPRITNWPMFNRTSEAYMARVEGDSLVVLNELKFLPHKALSKMYSMSQTNSAIVRAAHGYRGAVESVDYRGEKVLANAGAIPYTPWLMVFKVDKKELLTGLYDEMSGEMVSAIILIVLIWAGFSFIYSHQQRNYYKNLWSSQEKFRTTLYSIGDAVIITDNEGCVQHMNPVAEHLTGWKEAEAEGMSLGTIFHIIHEDTRELAVNPVSRVLEGGCIVGLANHTLLISKDGKEYPIADSGAPIKKNAGDIDGVVVVFRDQTDERAFQRQLEEDITSRKQLIAELLAAKNKAEESDRLKTVFLQNMSHEIRTPLNGILGFADLLTREDIPQAKILEYAGIIQRSGHRLQELINNVIDSSRIESGGVKLHQSEFSLRTLMHDVYHHFLFQAKNKGIELIYSHPSAEDVNYVIADSVRLHQVLMNLISNALKFTTKGTVEFGYRMEKSTILFFVRDTGRGISKEHQAFVFDRFYQEDTSMSRGFEGSGLGLSICRGLVELMGGTIWVDSEPETGSTFFYTIPLVMATASAHPLETEPEELPVGAPLVILIAEDDDSSFFYFQAALSPLRPEILRALNGREAVEWCKSRPDIHVVLMDIKMPEMDGIEATQKIRTFRSELPIIAQTAFSFHSEREQIMAAGCTDYLTKPVDRHLLVQTIQKYLRS